MTLTSNKIHLFRSTERANAYMKKLTESGECLGHKCTTPVQFVLNLANLVMEDTHIIDDSARLAHLISVVSSTEDFETYEYFSKPLNLMFLTNFIKQTTGTEQFMKALDSAKKSEGNFSYLEESAILLAEEYGNVINAFGLEELGTVASKVATEFKNCFEVTYEDVCQCQSKIEECIKSVANNSEDVSFNSIHSESINNNLNFTFATLSEVRAKNALFVDILRDMQDGQRVGIVTNDVHNEVEVISRLVSQMDIDARVEYKKSIKFLDTNFGQAIYACDESMHGEPSSVEINFSNFLHNPLSGVSLYKCLELERDLRENPMIARQRVADEMREVSPTFDLFMTCVSEPFTVDKTETLNAIASFIKTDRSLCESCRFENLAALQAFKEIAENLCLVGYDDELDFSIFNCIDVFSKCINGSERATKRIDVIDASSLSRLPEGIYDKVVFCDVSSKTFNASTSFDALHSIMQRMKLGKSLTSSEIARLNFITGVNASKAEVLFCIPFRDLRSNEELSPSFVIQELFLKTYGKHLIVENLNDECELLGVRHLTYGEDDVPLIGNSHLITNNLISRNVSQLDFRLKECCNIDQYLRKTEDGLVVLTPSEIETYCQCPYKWFYERRIAPQSLDYEFNQIERGNIVHLSFKTFYDELYKKGIFRLHGEEDASSHKELYEECYDRSVKEFLCSKEPEREHLRKAEGWLATIDVMQTLTDCKTCLQVQSIFPDEYVVAQSEMRIKPEQNVSYAGVVINGTLDRLDVSPESNSFIVVDYKGNIQDHGCGRDCFAITVEGVEQPPLPSKIQTLIYASCVQKMTNKKCDAAIYLSYNKLGPNRPPVVGAIEYRVIEKFARLLGDPSQSTIFMDMSEYLTRTETRVQARLHELLNGNIAPNPTSKKSCEFCSCIECPMRGRC